MLKSPHWYLALELSWAGGLLLLLTLTVILPTLTFLMIILSFSTLRCFLSEIFMPAFVSQTNCTPLQGAQHQHLVRQFLKTRFHRESVIWTMWNNVKRQRVQFWQYSICFGKAGASRGGWGTSSRCEELDGQLHAIFLLVAAPHETAEYFFNFGEGGLKIWSQENGQKTI